MAWTSALAVMCLASTRLSHMTSTLLPWEPTTIKTLTNRISRVTFFSVDIKFLFHFSCTKLMKTKTIREGGGGGGGGGHQQLYGEGGRGEEIGLGDINI